MRYTDECSQAPLDCLTVQRNLESVRPGSDDLAAPELASTAEHLRGCPACQAVLRQRERLDRRIGLMCRDVAVPSGLKVQILAALEHPTRAAACDVAAACEQVPAHKPSPAHEFATGGSPALMAGAASMGGGLPAPALPAPTTAGASTRPASARRTLRRALVTIAASLLVCGGLGLWLLRPAAPAIALEAVEQSTMEAFVHSNPLPPFVGSFRSGIVPRLPERMNLPASLAAAVPNELTIEGQRAAVFYFSIARPKLKGRGMKPLQACLVVIPRAVLKAPPEVLGGYKYSGGLAVTLWTEGDLAYVCCVSGASDLDLDRLFRQSAS